MNKSNGDGRETDLDIARLSRTIAKALRHRPELYRLKLDQQGWAELDQLLEGLRTHGHPHVSLEHIRQVLDGQKMGKVRYELDEKSNPVRIRALHGHSNGSNVPRIALKPTPPPYLLFHGTSQKSTNSILAQGRGLRPMGRQYVHLSVDKTIALKVGRRKNRDPVLLEIQAQRAFELDGISFYYQSTGDTGIWLADAIPSEFIRIAE